MLEWHDDDTRTSYLARKRAQCGGDYQATERFMDGGPFLDADGYTIVIPSAFYNAEAVKTWKQLGFQYDKDTQSWKRDAHKPYKGRVYSLRAWLKTARGEYAKLWPQATETEAWERNEERIPKGPSPHWCGQT